MKDSVLVKMGYTQSRVYFPLCHLVPLHTTERPGIVSWSQAQPIISVPGQRVVIIGADLEGKEELVGQYAFIIASYYQLHDGHACIQVSSRGPLGGQYGYFDVKSLCQSHCEPVEWMGRQIE